MTSWLKSSSSKLMLVCWMLPIRVFCGCVYFSLRLGSSQTGVRSMTLRFWPSERMLRVSCTKTSRWSLAVVSLPRLIPPGTFWHEPVFTFRYSMDVPEGEIGLTYYTRFSRVAVRHRHWSCSIRRVPYPSSWYALPKWYSSHYRTVGYSSGKSSTDYAVLTNDDQSVFLRSSPDDP